MVLDDVNWSLNLVRGDMSAGRQSSNSGPNPALAIRLVTQILGVVGLG